MARRIMFTGGSACAGWGGCFADPGFKKRIAWRELPQRFCPGVPLQVDDLGEDETLLSNRKARRVPGFAPEHSWRRYHKP